MADNNNGEESPTVMDSVAPVTIKKKRKLLTHRKKLSDEEDDGGLENKKSNNSNNSNTPNSDLSPLPESENSTSISDLLTLRKLKASQRREGIDVHKLNSIATLDAKRRKKDKSTSGSGGGKGDRLRDAEDEELKEGKSKAQRLVKSYNFQHQSTALDVDKHMIAYIESELKKRKGEQTIDLEKEISQLDPKDELYQVSEKYRIDKLAHKEEGNVTLSSAMLTGIPEIDLGIENRLKNITSTEQAKKEFLEKRQKERARRRGEGEDYKNDNSQFFYRSSTFGDEDKSLRDMINAHEEQLQQQQSGEQKEPEKPHQHQQQQSSGNNKGSSGNNKGRRREVATDEATMERFKKRMHNQYNRR